MTITIALELYEFHHLDSYAQKHVKAKSKELGIEDDKLRYYYYTKDGEHFFWYSDIAYLVIGHSQPKARPDTDGGGLRSSWHDPSAHLTEDQKRRLDDYGKSR